MNPFVLTVLLVALVVVPLALIAICFVIGKLFRAPRRFASVLFVILFIAGLGAATYGYLGAGAVTPATVTRTSERVVVDDALRAHHEFELSVQIPDLGDRTIAVPARIYDQASIGQPIGVRAGSVLGVKLARAQGERIRWPAPLGPLACAARPAGLRRSARASRAARLPAILLMLAAVAGIGLQPAIAGVLPRGPGMAVQATVTAATPVGSRSLSGVPAGYLRGPFSVGQRWMWANSAKLEFVAVTFTPSGRTAPVTAVDVIPAEHTPAAGTSLPVRYQQGNPRQIVTSFSQARACSWILLGVLALIESILLAAAVVSWRRRASRRRTAASPGQPNRDVSQAIEVSTRRDGISPSGETRPQPVVVPAEPMTGDTQPMTRRSRRAQSAEPPDSGGGRRSAV